jgi:predicted DNA-binding transcriptional regulator YafY
MKNSNLILRYLYIIRYVQRVPYCSKKELIEYVEKQFSERGDDQKLGLSPKTIQRDIDDIQNVFGLSIKQYNTNKGYYIPKRSEEKPDDTLDQLMEYIDLLQIGLDKGLPDYILPEKRRSRGTEYLMPIKNAIADNQELRFEYRKFDSNENELKTVQPYLLKESRGRWYLLGLDSSGTAKSYGLDRISELKPTGIFFRRNDEIDWVEMYAHSFAMFTDEPVEEVILSYDKRDGNYLEAMPMHSSQKITRQGDRVIVTLKIRITLDFIMELMSRSWSLQVISPLSLKQRMHEIYKEAMERNG